MSVRAKFNCDSKTVEMVMLTPVYTGSPENDSFYRFTPGGQILLTILNPAAIDQFEVGKSYYVDFILAE